MNDLPSKKDLESSGDNYGFRLNVKQFISIVLALLLVLFIVQNTNDVQVKFLTVTFETSQWLVLAVTALLGAVAGAGVFARRQKRKADRS